MKNLRMMMLSASIAAMIFVVPSCKKDKINVPIEDVALDPDDEKPLDPDQDPDTTDPDATDPDATDPDSTDPDSTDPDATEPDSTDPDTSTNPDGPEEPTDPTLPDVSDFDLITRAHIVQKADVMSDNYFESTNASGILWNKGVAYVFVTSGGKYGKFRVKGIYADQNYKLVIHAVIFNEDGTIAKENMSLDINGTWACDLDELVETSSYVVADFGWSRSTATITYFSPANNAKFFKYLSE